MTKQHSILLVQPMHEKMKKKERSSIDFPWGLAILARLAKDAGHRVEVVDGQALQFDKFELAPHLGRYDADIIGISAFSTQFNAVRHLCREIKSNRPNVTIVVGGPLATYQPEFTLEQTLADIAVVGEGEYTFLDLLDNLASPDQVKGIAYRRDGKVARTMPRTELPPLDDLPMPDYSMFDMERYTAVDNAFARKKNTGRAMGVFAARGCPYTCNFCSRSSKSYRAMSPRKVYDMLFELKSTFRLEEIFFTDELFLASKKHFREFAPLIRSLDLPWSSQGRINVMDDEFLGLVKAANCIGVGYGVESGSQKILDAMNKRLKVEQIEKVLKATKQAKIPMKVQLMFAYPGEDEQTVQETVDLMRRCDLPGRRMTVTTPVPGAPLWDQCVADGRIPDQAEYLVGIEKSFGWGKIHVNLTDWPDDEIYPRKFAAEEAMRRNYINNKTLRRVRYYLGSAKRAILGRLTA